MPTKKPDPSRKPAVSRDELEHAVASIREPERSPDVPRATAAEAARPAAVAASPPPEPMAAALKIDQGRSTYLNNLVTTLQALNLTGQAAKDIGDTVAKAKDELRREAGPSPFK